jgi:hypothetical protein
MVGWDGGLGFPGGEVRLNVQGNSFGVDGANLAVEGGSIA